MMGLGMGLGLRFFNRSGTTTPPSGLWILLTGLWADSGEWIDSETWNDGA
jgi:hypothetical protein